MRLIPGERVEFYYDNYRGEKALRSCIVRYVRFGISEHHEVAQWLLEGYDLHRCANRTYALKDISQSYPSPQEMNDGKNS